MKLAMAMTMRIGEKVQLRQELREQRRRDQFAKTWRNYRRQLAAGTRLVFVFLFGATLLVFLFSHVSAIQHSAEAKVSRVAASIVNSSQPSRIRQSTMAYEQEVDEISK